MSALSLRLPNSLHERARELAEREGISINQLVTTALAEKMSALMTEEFLDTRARRGNRSAFLRALREVPDMPPDSADRLPAALKRPTTSKRTPSRAKRRSRRDGA